MLGVLTFACNATKTTGNDSTKSDKSITFLNASLQSWTAGVQGGGSGTEYYFPIILNTSKEISFTEAWINNQSYDVFLSIDNAAISNDPLKVQKGDTITLRVSALNNTPPKSTSSSPPITYDGAALIGYKIKDKQRYYIIKEIEELPFIPHQ